ncbi:hypothetical protein MRB53_041835 [Persea americana]|nr:hypothetical protein MRB53_041835 [Persea americana]
MPNILSVYPEGNDGDWAINVALESSLMDAFRHAGAAAQAREYHPRAVMREMSSIFRIDLALHRMPRLDTSAQGQVTATPLIVLPVRRRPARQVDAAQSFLRRHCFTAAGAVVVARHNGQA